MLYQDIRLSPHFVLLDFMHMREVYMSGIALPCDEWLTPETVSTGRNLCQQLLEPLMRELGPCSVAGGWTPPPVVERHKWLWPQPHRWVHEKGAAGDVCWHDQNHMGVAPIDICHWIDRSSGIEFERLITYAGSEFICTTWKEVGPRHALHENIRTPAGPKFRTHGYGVQERIARLQKEYPPATLNWQRRPGELPQKFKGLRAQHVRVGRYFTLLDFCRSETGLARGMYWVLNDMTDPAVQVARMFAEILDPVVAEVGRLSIVKGLQPRPVARHESQAAYRWQPGEPYHRVRFLLPEGRRLPTITHGAVLQAVQGEHPSLTTMVTMDIEPFEPVYQDEIGGFPEYMTLPVAG